MTDEQLQNEYLILDEMIYGENECYSPRDMAMLNIVERELHRRGYEVSEERVISFIKE